ncbi:MAG TPA: DUF6174 domain-containing protein [Gemmatimonadota bacterium]|jgi:hypothetical protein|nr:DUF6174 domain-containing protein [Gemmatimonadota bacterium]
MKIASLTAVSLLALGCSVSGPDDEEDGLARLADAVQAWQASGISDYELAMRRTCGECLPLDALAVVVTVSGGDRTVSLASNGEPVTALPRTYPDVEGLFDLIEDMVLAGADVDVDYDDEIGFPRSISVDPVPDAVDDEFGYVIDDLTVGRNAGLRAEIAAQREKWAARRIEDYQLTFSRACFCPPEGAGLVVLNVLEGEPVEWLYFLSGDPVAPEWQPVFPTVDGLFDFLEDAVDRGAEEIEVAFDPGFGLPTTVRVDYRLAAADEEIAYEVEKLVPIDDGVSPTPGREAARPRAIS